MSPGIAEPKGTGSQAVAHEPGTQEEPQPHPGISGRRRGVRRWFRRLLRSLLTLAIALVILFVAGVAADAALHQVERTTTSSASYTGIDEIDLTVEGDGLTAVHGSPSIGHGVKVDFTDRATVFDPPQRTLSQVGDVLTITERCPDSQCSSDLDLTTGPNTELRIREGDADRMAQAGLSLSGIDGPVTLYAVPATVTVTGSSALITGLVVGKLECDYPAICLVQTVS
jgi:hypothetical protein